MMSPARRNAVLLLLAGGIAVIIAAYVKLSRVSAEVHGAFVHGIAERTQMRLNLFTRPIVDNLLIINEWSGENRLDLSRIADLNALFIPIIEKVPHISEVLIGDATGAEYRLYQGDGAWITRFQDPGVQGGQSFFQRWRTAGQAAAEWSEPRGEAPREKAWYREAVEHTDGGEVVWTSSRQAGGAPGDFLSASIRLKEKEKAPAAVAAFKVRMTDVLTLKQQLRATPNTRVFLMDGSESVSEIALEKAVEVSDLDAAAPAPSGDGVLADAIAYWRENGRKTEEGFEFRSGGSTWWGGMSPLSLGDQKMWVGVLVPHGELLPEARRSRRLVFAIIGAVMVIVVLATLLFVRRYSRDRTPALFPRRSRYGSEAAVRDLIRSGESGDLEFKSTLRWNLKAGRAGKEIELAWLKTVAAYMNTDGGILLIGVADSGDILGLESDDFSNDDKCLLHVNNLIKQHIGLAFSPFIRYELLPAEGKKILVVECMRSGAPVFLKTGKDEAFYIRSGPASIRLTMSEALKYIQDNAVEA